MGKGQSKQSSGSPHEIIRNELEFSEIVRKRKGERKTKTEIKRREVVKYLEEKKLRTEDEAKTKLFRLPDEIWEKVLAEVADPLDLWNMWRVHPKFRHLSGEDQTQQCLLSQVLSIEKLPNLWKDKKERIRMLTTCRKLSRGMKISVDHLIEEDFMKILQMRGSQPSCYFNLDLNAVEKFELIYRNFSEGAIKTRAKCVFSRSFQVTVFAWQELEHECYVKFRNNVTSLFEIVGEQIWYLKLVLTDYIPPYLKNMGLSMNKEYSLLVHWISLLPNLKWLELEFDYMYGNQNDKITQDTFDHHPFPHLPHLERITFVSVRPKIEFVSSVILPNLHIKSLRLNCGKPSFYRMMKPILSLLNLDTFGDYLRGSNVNILKPLICSTWKLKSLFLNSSLDLKAAFTLLNGIPSLEHLYLYLGVMPLGKKIPHLNLPHLKHFEFNFSLESVSRSNVENVLFFTSLQFLIQSKKLTTLSLEWSCECECGHVFTSPMGPNPLGYFEFFMHQHQEQEMIKFQCGLADLKQSNLWDVFPELEVVKIKVFPHNLCDENEYLICHNILKPRLLRIK